MPSVLVGETRLPKNFKRYTSQFSLLELDCDPGNLPGKARLQSCADVAPDGFVFSLVVPQRLAALEPGSIDDKSWKAALNVARLLRAKWWVVRTPSSVRPTRRTREELGTLFKRLGENGLQVAWEPRGLWEQGAAAETAEALGVHLVQDIAREQPVSKGVLYTRLLALGRGARVGLGVADLVAQRVQQFDTALIVVEGQGAREIATATGQLAAAALEDEMLADEADADESDEADVDDSDGDASDAGDDEDDDDDEDDEDDEDDDDDDDDEIEAR